MSNQKKFEQFINDNLDSAYRYAYSIVHDQYSAEDIVAQSVEKALKSVRGLRDESKIKSWFFKIIFNTAMTQLKKSAKEVPINVSENEQVLSISIDDSFSDIGFEQMVSCLDESLKTIVVLRFLEDMMISEIASVLSENENTIKTRLYRALRILKTNFTNGRC